jgi:prephenate dehydrogenase
VTPRADRVLVVGTGLIGTSIGLALSRAGSQVGLIDLDPGRLRVAEEMGAGTAGPDGDYDACFICVPPLRTGQLIIESLRRDPSLRISDTASVKAHIEVEVEACKDISSAHFVGGHPIAGRERSGPTAASADLFAGRPWVLTERAGVDPATEETFVRLVGLCGARPVRLSAAEHDRMVAVSSHLPQLLASALSAEAASAGELAGGGLADMTRIADSDPALWAEIAAANSVPLAAALRRVSARLGELAADLESGSGRRAVQRLVTEGREGRRALPGKHGGQQRQYATVAVAVRDATGELARLFAAVAASGVNIEDVRLDHLPGLPFGLVLLSVEPAAAAGLRVSLQGGGWATEA